MGFQEHQVAEDFIKEMKYFLFMLMKVKKIRAVGSFKNFLTPNNNLLDLGKFNIILGKNATGKTTFTTILNSLNENEPRFIFQKKSLNCSDCQESVFNFQNDNNFVFNGVWKNNGLELDSKLDKFIIFNEEFIKKNFFDDKFEYEHKVNLHKIIFGEKGIEINNKINEKLARKRELKKEVGLQKSEEILEICNYPENNLKTNEEKFKTNNTKLQQVKSLEEIKKQQNFKEIELIKLDLDNLTEILNKDINSESHNSAKDKVNEFKQEYFKDSEEYEKFIELGVNNYKDKKCPFCHKQLDSDEIIDIYKKFFDQEFNTYKKELIDIINKFNEVNLELVKQKKSQIESDNKECLEYWKEKITLKELKSADLENVFKLKNIISKILVDKENNINLKIDLTKLQEFKTTILTSNSEIKEYNEIVENNNNLISEFKKELGDTSIEELDKEQKEIKRIIDRFDSKKTYYDEFLSICNSIETLKQEMTEYTNTMKSEYLDLINDKLLKLGLRNLKLKEIRSTKTANANNLNVEITLELENNEIDMKSNSDDEPAFNNTLSGGEKNALAFAFFLSQLEKTENLNDKILVFDDPLTSLDDDRKIQVSLQIKEFKDKVLQIIVLTHKNSFFKILYDCNKDDVKTFELKKDISEGSKLVKLDTEEFFKGDFVKRMEKLERFTKSDFNYPELDNDIRKVLEKIISTKYYLDRKKLGKTIVTYDIFNELFWSKGKLLDEKPRIMSICNLTNSGSHDDMSYMTIYEDLSYTAKKEIVLEVLDLIQKI